jgi:hypothetical protein
MYLVRVVFISFCYYGTLIRMVDDWVDVHECDGGVFDSFDLRYLGFLDNLVMVATCV